MPTTTPRLDGNADVDRDDGVRSFDAGRRVAMLPMRM
jgi:hypothetical protein